MRAAFGGGWYWTKSLPREQFWAAKKISDADAENPVIVVIRVDAVRRDKDLRLKLPGRIEHKRVVFALIRPVKALGEGGGEDLTGDKPYKPADTP